MRSSACNCLALCFLFAAGCAHQPLPEQTVREDLTPAAWNESIDGAALPSLTWTDFDDPDLNGLVHEALENNPDVVTALSTLDLALVNLSESRADQLPNYGIAAGAGASRTRNFDTLEAYRVTGQASYEVDLWGRLADRVELSELDIISAQAGVLTTRISLAAEVTNAYYDVRVLDERLRLQRNELDHAQTQYDIIVARYDAGLLSGIDVNNNEVLVQQIRARIEDLRGERALAEQRLATLVGKPPQAFTLDNRRQVPIPQLRLAPETPAEVLRVRPDIRSAEAQLRASEVNFDLARKAFYPTVTLTGSTGYASGSLSDLIRDSSFGWSLGADLIWTLLDNGARDRNLERARISATAQLASYRRTILAALQDVEGALTAQETIMRRLEIQQLQLAAQERLTRETEAKYRAGAVSGFDLITQQRSLILQREGYLSSLQDGVRAAVRVLRALGVAPDSAG